MIKIINMIDNEIRKGKACNKSCGSIRLYTQINNRVDNKPAKETLIISSIITFRAMGLEIRRGTPSLRRRGTGIPKQTKSEAHVYNKPRRCSIFIRLF